VAGTPVTKEVVITATPAPTAKASAGTLPRNGNPVLQWSTSGVQCWLEILTPPATNMRWLSMNRTALVHHVRDPYLFNMLDGKVYPLLADGPYAWTLE